MLSVVMTSKEQIENPFIITWLRSVAKRVLPCGADAEIFLVSEANANKFNRRMYKMYQPAKTSKEGV